MRHRYVIVAGLLAAVSAPAFALKYAAPEHQLKVDARIPAWKPGEVPIQPEEELNRVQFPRVEEKA